VILLGKMPSYQRRPPSFPQYVGKLGSLITFSDKKLMKSVLKKNDHLTQLHSDVCQIIKRRTHGKSPLNVPPNANNRPEKDSPFEGILPHKDRLPFFCNANALQKKGRRLY
jgi:hypothetical protein